MARYQVVLAYDGTDFYGFQRQQRGTRERTVQGVTEAALRQLGWQGRAILFAGRTDTGVHASGQVSAFDLDWAHPLDALGAALNAYLPLDVAVQSVQEANPDFHPRYDALARCYRFRIFCRAARDPLRERYAWRVWPAVDPGRLQQAALALVGEHDFAAFGTPPRAGGVTIRKVYRAGWRSDQDDLTFEIIANAFLYRMVRRLVRFQVAIGQAEIDVADVDDFLRSGSPAPPTGLAPAQGLTLVEVIYRREQFDSLVIDSL